MSDYYEKEGVILTNEQLAIVMIDDAEHAALCLADYCGFETDKPCEYEDLCGHDLCEAGGCVIDRARRYERALKQLRTETAEPFPPTPTET